MKILQDSDRSNGFLGLQNKDTETSAQALNAAVQNPLLYQNQAFGGLGGAGGLANLGGGLFSNQGQFGAGQFGGGLNPYLQNGLGGYQNGLGGYQNAAIGGLGGGYQNPYLGGGFGGGFGGLGGLGGVAPDIYTQGALSAQLYNNPLYGAGAGTLTGSAAGINPLLLRGVQNSQYPIIGGLGGLGAYQNPYLAAQALLSPYSNYNQVNNYPFASRFGIGAGTGRSGLGINRYNSQNSQNNNDEK